MKKYRERKMSFTHRMIEIGLVDKYSWKLMTFPTGETDKCFIDKTFI